MEAIVELAIELDYRRGGRSLGIVMVQRACDDAKSTWILLTIALTVVLLQENIDTKKELGNLVFRSRRWHAQAAANKNTMPGTSPGFPMACH